MPLSNRATPFYGIGLISACPENEITQAAARIERPMGFTNNAGLGVREVRDDCAVERSSFYCVPCAPMIIESSHRDLPCFMHRGIRQL